MPAKIQPCDDWERHGEHGNINQHRTRAEGDWGWHDGATPGEELSAPAFVAPGHAHDEIDNEAAPVCDAQQREEAVAGDANPSQGAEDSEEEDKNGSLDEPEREYR